MKKILTIAGSDPSGGAGVQADIKTITCHNHYAMSVISSLTAQNTLGVVAIAELPTEFVEKQLQCVFEDIFPDAVKIGMLGSRAIIATVAQSLKKYKPKNVVLDPVMVSTSGSKLLKKEDVVALKEMLYPLVDIITPNIAEAEVLADCAIKNKEDMQKAALIIAQKFDGAILIKGGHLEDSADDLLYENGKFNWLTAPREGNANTHGTGCTLSSAIACFLAAGQDMLASVIEAKEYVRGAIKANLDIGKGRGPLNHMYKNC